MKSYEFHDRALERIALLKQMLFIALLLFLKVKPQPRTRCRNLALRGSLSFFINGTTPSHNNHTPPCANSVRKRRRISRHGCHSSNCNSGTICFKSGRQRPILTKVSSVFCHYIKTNSRRVTFNRQRSIIPSVFLPPDHSQLIYYVLFDATYSQQSYVIKQPN